MPNPTPSWGSPTHTDRSRNILPEDLDRRAHLVRGKPRPLGMLAGLDEDTDAAMLIGCHARAGAGPAVLAHTMSGDLLDVRVAGRSLARSASTPPWRGTWTRLLVQLATIKPGQRVKQPSVRVASRSGRRPQVGALPASPFRERLQRCEETTGRHQGRP
ncbi:M55 family metallopeptidase [Micromonospora mangrovi]|uniref:M55 family metallopeptidase n=2 Tax=Micromonospora TaxID=1873 RepID=A0AAU8HLF7_9ACTN